MSLSRLNYPVARQARAYGPSGSRDQRTKGTLVPTLPSSMTAQLSVRHLQNLLALFMNLLISVNFLRTLRSSVTEIAFPSVCLSVCNTLELCANTGLFA